MISFVGAIKLGFQRYFDFRGKSTAAEFWPWVLFGFLVSAVLTLWASIYYDMTGASALFYDVTGTADLGLILVLFAFVTVGIPGLAVTVRRLHDINKSGWWLLLGLISWLIIPAIVLLIWFIRPSYDEANRQGPGAYVIVGSIIGFIVGIVFFDIVGRNLLNAGLWLYGLPSLRYLLFLGLDDWEYIHPIVRAVGVVIHLIIYSACIFAGAKIGRWAYRKTGN